MARNCTICCHEKLESIDRALIRPHSIPELAGQFEVSEDALHRHEKKHLKAAVQRELRARMEARTRILLDRLADLEQKTLRAVELADKSGSPRVMLHAIREGRANIQLLSRLTASVELPEATPSLSTSDEWITVRTAILEALTPFPEARHAVSHRLTALSVADLTPESSFQPEPEATGPPAPAEIHPAATACPHPVDDLAIDPLDDETWSPEELRRMFEATPADPPSSSSSSQPPAPDPILRDVHTPLARPPQLPPPGPAPSAPGPQPSALTPPPPPAPPAPEPMVAHHSGAKGIPPYPVPPPNSFRRGLANDAAHRFTADPNPADSGGPH